LPVLLLSIFGGVIADRLPKRSILISSRIVLAMVSLCIALLLSMDRLEYWHLLAASFLNGLVWAFSMAAMQSIIPELVPRELTPNAVALGSTAWNTSRIAGPALAGFLIASVGGAGAYYASVAIYLLGMVFLVVMPAARSSVRTTHQPFLRELAEGIGYMRSSRVVMTVMGLEIIMTLFSMIYLSFMPIFSDLLGADATGYGILMGVGGIGALAGAITLATIGNIQHKGRIVLLASIWVGALLIVFSWVRSMPAAIAVLVLIGVGSSTFYAADNTILQMNVDDRMRGRVMSVYSMIAGLTPIGLIPAGALAEAAGAPVTVTAGAVIIVVYMAGVWFLRPFFRDLP
jgi:MFS family permease